MASPLSSRSLARRFALALGALGLAVACSGATVRPIGPIPAAVDEQGVALSGYDPVSYFPEGGGIPRPGSSDIVARHEGAIYRFVGQRSQRRFLADPTRYVPLYGGWDAWSMVSGQREQADPTRFLIRDGRILLFIDGTFADGRQKWLERDHDELRRKADQTWFAMLAGGRGRNSTGS